MNVRRLLSARRTLVALACTALSAAASAQGPTTVRIAVIDPLSGPFAAVGTLMLRHVQFAVDDLNAKGGALGGKVKFEVLPMDSKLSAQESRTALQAAIDQGATVVVTGGSGSTVVAALVEAVTRHNERSPTRQLIVLNHSSIDPDMTGKRCNFWHFQLEANTAMKMKALANYIKRQPDIQNVYLLNQDYAHGRQWAHYGQELVGLARPDIKFVGSDFIAIGRVKDFVPYVTKVKAAKADSVITGNWGPDMQLLLRAAGELGTDLRYFNHSAGSIPGTVTAVSTANIGRLTWVAEWHPGQADVPKIDALARAYRTKTGQDFLAPRIDFVPRFLAAAIDKAGSSEPLAVARAMEDLTVDSALGPLRMRREDHQLLLPQVVNTIARVDGRTVKQGYEGTQWGFRTDASFSGNELAQGTECKMVRP